MSNVDTSAVRRAWGWVAALRDGTTTPWSQWSGEAEPTATRLPGAQQLELLRRLNRARGGVVPNSLADRVLVADLPGRGRSDLPLAGGGLEPRFGPPPVDPVDLADRELLRVATGLLASDLASVPAGRAGRRRYPRRRPWAPSYELAGDEWQVAPLDADLRRLARPPQHHPSRVFVLGADLATMLAHSWTSRAFAESGAGWSVWLERFVEDDRLPHRADLLTHARAWGDALNRRRVVVVFDPARMVRPLRLVGHRLPDPPPVTADGVDLARRIATTLGILVSEERRNALMREVLLPRLPQDPARTVAVPAQWHDWVRERAERMHAELLADRYPVLGDPARLVPQAPAVGRDPDAADVLELALRLLLDPVTVRTEETT